MHTISHVRTSSIGSLSESGSSESIAKPGSPKGKAKVEGSPSLESAAKSSHAAADLDVTSFNLGGKGGTINKIRQWFRNQVFGSSDSRKGTADSGIAGKTELQDKQDQLRASPNVKPVSITTADGVTLNGHFASPNSRPGGAPDTSKPVVLLLTGSGGFAEDQGADMLTAYSNRHDVNVLSVNYRGYGDSGGAPTEKGLYKDGQAMFQHLLDQGFRSDQIVIHGFSMGAVVAGRLHKMAEDNNIPLKGVVYDRPMGSTFKGTKAHAGMGALGSLVAAMAKDAVGKFNASSEIARSGQLKTPVIVTHDTETLSGVGQQLGQRLQAIDPNVKLISTNAGHMNSSSAMWRARNDLTAMLS